MNNNYSINKLRVQQFGLTATVKDDDGKEHYFHKGHEYIEIGGIKWAVTNVGAEQETDSGLYFAFGEPKGYTAEQVLSGERNFNEKEYTNVNFNSVKNHWGGKWRLPTDTEFRALLFSATHKWVYDYEGSGVNGRLFTDKTDSSKKLFFPAVGFCDYYGVNSVGYFGYYWSNSLLSNSSIYGIYLHLSRWFSGMSYNDRCIGFSIRGVIGD